MEEDNYKQLQEAHELILQENQDLRAELEEALALKKQGDIAVDWYIIYVQQREDIIKEQALKIKSLEENLQK